MQRSPPRKRVGVKDGVLPPLSGASRLHCISQFIFIHVLMMSIHIFAKSVVWLSQNDGTKMLELIC